ASTVTGLTRISAQEPVRSKRTATLSFDRRDAEFCEALTLRLSPSAFSRAAAPTSSLPVSRPRLLASLQAAVIRSTENVSDSNQSCNALNIKPSDIGGSALIEDRARVPSRFTREGNMQPSLSPSLFWLAPFHPSSLTLRADRAGVPLDLRASGIRSPPLAL